MVGRETRLRGGRAPRRSCANLCSGIESARGEISSGVTGSRLSCGAGGGVGKRGTQTGEGLTIRTKAPKVATVDAAHYQLQTARLGCRVSEHADEVGAAGGLVFGKDRYVARLTQHPIYGAFLGVGVEEASEQVDGDAITFPTTS